MLPLHATLVPQLHLWRCIVHWVHHCNYTYFGVQLEVPGIAVEHNMNSRLQYVANLQLRNQQFFCTQEWGGVLHPGVGRCAED